MAKAETADLQDVFQQVLGSLGTLPGVIGQLGSIISRMTQGLTDFLSRASSLFTAGTAATAVAKSGGSNNVGATLQLLIPPMERVTQAVSRLATAFERKLVEAKGLPWMGPNQPAPVSPKSIPVPGAAAGGEAAAGATAGLGSLAAVAGVAAAGIGALALTVNLVEQQFQKALGFVSKFNPGVVAQFQMMLDNLSATIGTAFVPLVQAASQVVQRWTSALAPVMQALVPVITEVSNTFGNILVRVLQQVATLVRGMVPVWAAMAQVVAVVVQAILPMVVVVTQVVRVLQLMMRAVMEFTPLGLIIKTLSAALTAFAEVTKVLEAAFDILEVVVSTVFTAVNSFVSGLFGGVDVMGSLNRAIQWVIRNMFVLAVQMAKLVGAIGLVDALIANVEGKTAPGAVAAQTPQIKSLDQLSKDIALAAAAAGGAAGPGGIRDEREFWTKTLEEMKAAKANGVSITEMVRQIRDAILKPFGGGAAPAPAANGANPGAGGLPGGLIGAGLGALAGPAGMFVGAGIGAGIGRR